MWIYNIWGQFEKLKTIHLNTNWYLKLLYPKKKKKKTLQEKKSLFIILYLSIEIFLIWMIYLKKLKKKIRAKTQVMNEMISS